MQVAFKVITIYENERGLKMNYPNLFAKGKLGKREVKNRIVMSAMGHNMANADGSVSENMIAYYTARAKGGAGTIITGVVCIDYPSGKSDAIQHRIDQVDYINGLARLAREVHNYGALLLPQLQHAGMSTRGYVTNGESPVLVSPPEEEKHAHIGILVEESMLDQVDASVPRKVLTIDAIKRLEKKFILSALNCQLAGCDGVEIHGAHGYLISQFLSTVTNKRTDEYGGSIENRMRFAINVLKGIRKECGPNFVLGIRMPVHKFDSDGLTDSDCQIMAQAFENAGCDFIDCSGGFASSVSELIETQSKPEGNRVALAQKIKNVVTIPVFATGKLRHPSFCDAIIEEGKADFVCLGRPFLSDPDWAEKAKSGKENEIRQCINCLDGCFGALGKHQSLTCVLNPKVGYEWEYSLLAEPKKKKRVVIVGGGIAGMQAAITATERGHKAIILEKSSRLGGQLHLASVPPHKQDINDCTKWFSEEIVRKDIEVNYNTEATFETIMSFNPDNVIVATGALPGSVPIKGVEKAIQSWSLLDNTTPIPQAKKVAIIGGGIVGCEVALLLAEQGNSVTIIEMLPDYAAGLELTNKLDLEKEMQKSGITIALQARVEKIESGKVSYSQAGTVKNVDAELVYLATGQRPVGAELVQALEKHNVPCTQIGDSKKPAKILEATSSAFFSAIQL